MKDKEIFDGFNIILVKATEGQPYSAAEKVVVQSVKNPTRNVEDVEKRGKEFYDNLTKKAHTIFKELICCIEKGMNPSDEKVQVIIRNHHSVVEETQAASKDVYRAMALLYGQHPEFRKQMDPFHPELAIFMAKAMQIFADRNL